MSFDFELAMSRQLLFGEMLARNARKFPDREAFVHKGVRVTYGELDERVNRLANSLLSRGIQKGDKVAVLLKNRREILEIYFAAGKIGAVNVPLNFRLAPREITFILNNSDSQILFMEEEFIPAIEKGKNELKEIREYIVVEKEPPAGYSVYEEVLKAGSPVRPEICVDDDDDMFILYTAGTTGLPKGAVLSHKNVIVNAMTMIMERDFPIANPDQRVEEKNLCVAPLFHTAAITGTAIAMVAGVTVVLQDFDPLEILKTIQKEKITTLFLVPAMWLFLLEHPDFKKYDVSSLRLAGYGAAPMPPALKKRILAAFPNAGLQDTFGQTEMSPATTTLSPRDALRKDGSVGLPIMNVEARVVDSGMNDVPVGQVGEIVYRGPNMFKGYYKNPEGTAEAFHGGWFHSGDLVRRDEEGFIYIVDRKKDMIISGGENIYPAEVEAVLYGHAKILEAAVIGVPDPQWGEAVKAFVVLREGQQLTAEEVIAHCTENLARYKRPRYVEFMKALPRNAAGKVLKRELRSKA